MNVAHILNGKENKVQELFLLETHLFHMVGEGGSVTPKSVSLTISSIWLQEYIRCLKIMTSWFVGKEKNWKMELDHTLRHKLSCWPSGCGAAVSVSLLSVRQLLFGAWDRSSPGPLWSQTSIEVMGMLLCGREDCCSETLCWWACRNLLTSPRQDGGGHPRSHGWPWQMAEGEAGCVAVSNAQRSLKGEGFGLAHSLQDWNPSCFREQLTPWYRGERTEDALWAGFFLPLLPQWAADLSVGAAHIP